MQQWKLVNGTLVEVAVEISEWHTTGGWRLSHNGRLKIVSPLEIWEHHTW